MGNARGRKRRKNGFLELSEQSEVARKLMYEYRLSGGSGQELSWLTQQHRQPEKAIPVLVDWLDHLEERWENEDVEERELARILLIEALGTPSSRETAAIPALIAQFDHSKGLSVNTLWAAGNSLYRIPADDTYFDQLVGIALDPSWGSGREMVVDWLGRSQRKDEAAEAALSLLDDETVQGHALEALAQLRTQGIRDVIEPFTKSKNRWHRRTATRILNHLVED
ncbi:HEAT repeat domain-containing protein [Nocardia sp. NPDC004068]|uniref:HEAT repeat domain-containing protein n=1 Tax=Nocardia sp. NPDC004068 TaxID=3364303 RepID=UPI00367B6B42